MSEPEAWCCSTNRRWDLPPWWWQQVFELVRRIRAEGYTVLIVEQNVAQVLKVVDRAYLLEVGKMQTAAARAAELAGERRHPQGVSWGSRERRTSHGLRSSTSSSWRPCSTAFCWQGLLALLALGLNLDVRRHRRGLDLLRRTRDGGHVRGPLLRLQHARRCRSCSPAAIAHPAIVAVAVARCCTVLVIRPVLDSEPINQLLVTGGVLFFLQAAATMAFGIEFRNHRDLGWDRPTSPT